jgi:MFS family permease
MERPAASAAETCNEGSGGPRQKSAEYRALAVVSLAHFVNHFQNLVLPPLFPFLTSQLGIGFVDLGFALTISNTLSVAAQFPVGYLVDRVGSQRMLVLALVTSAAAFIGFGLSPGYPRLLLAAALLGLANSVFHPADYAILSARIPPARVGRAFSIRTFCSFLGTAVAPVTTIAVAASLGLGFCPSSAKGILRLPASGSRRAICGGLVQRRNIDLNQRGPISRRYNPVGYGDSLASNEVNERTNGQTRGC